MESSRNTQITHVNIRHDLLVSLVEQNLLQNDSKSVHISVVRSVCTIMCLWPSLCMFWLYGVVNKIQIIKKKHLFNLLTFSLTCLKVSHTDGPLAAFRGGPFCVSGENHLIFKDIVTPSHTGFQSQTCLKNFNQCIVFCKWVSRMILT